MNLHHWKGIVVGLILVGFSAPLQAEETTLTTYYPSPRGVYEELRATNNVYIATQGSSSVGIGTMSPTSKLEVAAGTSDNALDAVTLSQNFVTTGHPMAGPGLVYRVTNNTPNTWNLARVRAVGQAGYGGQLTFETNPGGSGFDTTTERMRIDKNGNVGIGIPTPTTTPSPTNALNTGNLDVNDVYLRATGRWLTQSPQPAFYYSQPLPSRTDGLTKGRDGWYTVGSGTFVLPGPSRLYVSGHFTGTGNEDDVQQLRIQVDGQTYGVVAGFQARADYGERFTLSTDTIVPDVAGGTTHAVSLQLLVQGGGSNDGSCPNAMVCNMAESLVVLGLGPGAAGDTVDNPPVSTTGTITGGGRVAVIFLPNPGPAEYYYNYAYCGPTPPATCGVVPAPVGKPDFSDSPLICPATSGRRIKTNQWYPGRGGPVSFITTPYLLLDYDCVEP